MSKPKIYISSTFFDLQDHRQYLINALSKTESFDIVAMENYGTRSTPPIVKCINDVKSTEFYVLLLGKRYGFIPQGQPLSVTHMEYNTAIGNVNNVPGMAPNTNKCVLPFIIDNSWAYPEAINNSIEAERKKDGDQLTSYKDQQLKELRDSIGTHYTIEPGGFTTPSDLTSKVLASLIFALIERNYTSVVKSLKLRRELSYRCDRSAARIDFLDKDRNTKRFFKAFIIHGEKPEGPIFFSNNMTEYELNAGERSRTLNMDDYDSNSPEKFLTNFIKDAYQSILKTFPEHSELTLDSLALRIISEDRFNNVVLIYDMEYDSWKEKYKRNLILFFDKLVAANSRLKDTSKTFYLLINIRYEKAKEKIKENQPSYILLERLSPVKKSHIEEWVRTFLFSHAQKDGATRNFEHDMARKISDHYFRDFKGSTPFSMEIAKNRLTNIIDDFNKNADFFSDYKNLFRP